jgi:hypothetical protein
MAYTTGIQNWKNQGVKLDFGNLRFKSEEGSRPSDIDMMYIGKDGTLILAEGKNEMGTLTPGQKRMYHMFIDGYCRGTRKKGVFIYFTHDVYQQDGGTKVDVASCFITSLYVHDGQRGQEYKRLNGFMTVENAMKKFLPEEEYVPLLDMQVEEEPLDLDSIPF